MAFKYLLNIFISIILMCFLGKLNAQVFKPGFILGVNKCEIDGLPYGQNFGYNQTKISLMFGPTISTEINSNLDFELQLRYSQLGMKKPMNPHWNDYVSWNLKLDYLQIPLLANIKIYQKFSLSPGLTYGRLVGLRFKDPLNAIDPIIRDRTWYRKSDLSASAYVNYEIEQYAKVFIGVSHSLIPINVNATESFLSPFRYNRGSYNLSWHLGVRFYFLKTKGN
jgi:hypothetical protein